MSKKQPEIRSIFTPVTRVVIPKKEGAAGAESAEQVKYVAVDGAEMSACPPIDNSGLKSTSQRYSAAYKEACRVKKVVSASDVKGAGRPSYAKKAIWTQANLAATQYAELTDSPLTAQEYIASLKSEDVSWFRDPVDTGKQAKQGEGLDQTSQADIDAMEEEELNDLATDRSSSPLLRLLERSAVHLWGSNGDHLGWAGKKQFQEKTLLTLGYQVSRATYFRILANEKTDYAEALKSPDAWTSKESGFVKRPNVSQLMHTLGYAKSALDRIKIEPLDSTDHQGRPYVFRPEWMAELQSEVDVLSEQVGFGPAMLSCVAEGIVSRRTFGIVTFTASERWCRWALRALGYVKRRKASRERVIR
jgi:hypothetical protein